MALTFSFFLLLQLVLFEKTETVSIYDTYLEFFGENGTSLYKLRVSVGVGERTDCPDANECGFDDLRNYKNFSEFYGNISKICGYGIFMMYTKKNYAGSTYMFIATKSPTCTNHDVILRTKSLQHILKGAYNFERIGRASTFFEGRNYSGRFHHVFDNRKALVETVLYRSFILIGPQRMVMQLKSTKNIAVAQVCLQTPDMGPLTICPIANFNWTMLFPNSGENWKFKSTQNYKLDKALNLCYDGKSRPKTARKVFLNCCFGVDQGPVVYISNLGRWKQGK
jgi:hypothetical protein